MDIKDWLKTGKSQVSEGEVVSFADYKAKKDDADVFTDLPQESDTVNVHIDSVTCTFVEGKQGDDRFPINKPLSFEEMQAKIYEEDYKVANCDVEHGGYDKFYYNADITIDGKKETYSEGRLDLGDGFKYGAENVSIKYMMMHYLPKYDQFNGKKIVIDNPDVKYDIDAYKSKYGTREENIDKFITEHPVELPQGKDYSAKATVEEGDIFYTSDSDNYYGKRYYDFFKVVRTTKASAWVKPLKDSYIEVPEKVEEGTGSNKFFMVDKVKYTVPTDEVIDADAFGMDFDKPFKIGVDYNKKPMLSQGSKHKVYLRAWNGKALKEGLEMKKSIYTALNEEIEKYIEEPSKSGANEIASRLDADFVVTRCNNCMTYYNTDVDTCKKCNSDKYLMDMTADDLKHQKVDLNSIKIEESLIKDNDLLNHDAKFRYQMLSRMQQDCEYFLGYGNGYEKHLWAGNVEDQIKYMKDLWNSFDEDEKPEWLSMEDIDNYEKDMLAKRSSAKAEELKDLFEATFRGGKLNCFETKQGVIYFEPKGEKLVFGDMTNAGIIPQYEFDYDFEHSFDFNMQGMVDQIMETEGYPIDEDMAETSYNNRMFNHVDIKEKFQKLIIKDFIRLAKEYYGNDYSSKMKEDKVNVTCDEEPNGYMCLKLNICGDEQLLISAPLKEVNQDFFVETAQELNMAIENEEINLLQQRFSESLNEAKEYPKQLAQAIKKCWYGDYKDKGRYAKIGKWEIGLGGYDTGYEVSFDGTPIFAIRTTWGDNKVDMYQDEKDIKNLCGYNFKQIMKAINEVDPETILNEPEQMYRLVIKTDEDNLSDVNEILGHYSEIEADDIDDNSYDSIICFYVNKNDQDILNQIYKDLKELNNDAIELKEPFEIY